MALQVECSQCRFVYLIEEDQDYATCPRCGFWFRTEILRGGPVQGFIVLALITALRLAVVLWLPLIILAALVTTVGATSRPLLILLSIGIPFLALWYWLADWQRRTTGQPLNMPKWIVNGMKFLGKALRWGFGWLLTTIGQKVFYAFLRITGQSLDQIEKTPNRLPYRVVFAQGYSLAVISFTCIFTFLWDAPPPEQLFFYNVLTIGITLETSVSLGFLLSLLLWPMMIGVEAIKTT